MSRFCLVVFGLAAAACSGSAAADLMLHPPRVVFDKNQRAAQLDLINNGTETATYRIRVVNRRMSETGDFSAVDTPAPGEQFVGDMLRYSPRQVVLEPGAAQTVRLLLRKPAGLAPGEYRSHLVFERLPDVRAPASKPQPKPSGDGVQIELKALISVSIPVILRHGETAASVSISNLELQKPSPGEPAVLSFAIQRSGTRSVYGDLVARFAPNGGREYEVGQAKGLAVYTPNPVRRAKLALTPPSGLVLTRGTLRLVYRERPEEGGKTLAEAALQLP